ncbi:MAG: DUF2156 domain-containing protein [Bacteroidales bacterium]|nr:DUF2156 domain-containing protein [Bacteroidales bacterium]
MNTETTLQFEPIGLTHAPQIGALAEAAGLRNCNYSVANLLSWSSMFGTSVAALEGGLVVRYGLEPNNEHTYILLPHDATEASLSAIAAALRQAVSGQLRIAALEGRQAQVVAAAVGHGAELVACRDRQDYIYSRAELEQLHGRAFRDKRNHVNKFRSLYPDYTFAPLTTGMLAECWQVEQHWRHAVPSHTSASTLAEMRSMRFVFEHWDELPMIGGAIMVDGRMVAFSYGCPINSTLVDVCVEKADTAYEGAFNIVNLEFVRHLPEQFELVNREEDMGLEGLRKAKMSYNPVELLDYYYVCHEL